MDKKNRMLWLVLLLMMLFMLTACNKQEEVVVYTSVDQLYSEKIFKDFQKESGIQVKAVYDIEANKTVGLAKRLNEEKKSPQADVFWSGEILQTIDLKEKDVFEAINLMAADSLPASFIDDENYWFAFGGRDRVMIYNKERGGGLPQRMEDLPAAPEIKELGMAYPVFGTTNTEVACRYANWGPEKARAYYRSLKEAGIQVVDGNSVVKDFVSQKKLLGGLTDTDDALAEMQKNQNLGLYLLDQDGEGALVIPNSVAKVKGGPNPDQAKVFMEYLLRQSTEQSLVDDGWIQVPVHKEVTVSHDLNLSDLKIMTVDFNQAYEMLEMASQDMMDIFIR